MERGRQLQLKIEKAAVMSAFRKIKLGSKKISKSKMPSRSSKSRTKAAVKAKSASPEKKPQ